jgi:Tol biopolymer transport system component
MRFVVRSSEKAAAGRHRRLTPIAAATSLVVVACLALGAAACGRGASGPHGTIAVTGASFARKIALVLPAARATEFVAAPDDVVRYDLSPDGSRIALTGLTGMWLMGRDGSHARRIFDGGGELAWSPDGRRLVFAESDPKQSLFTISADGKTLARIIGHADQPDWTPDGKQVVFVRNPEQSSRLGIISAVDSDGRALHGIVGRGRWKDPRVSPDGSTVAFDDHKDIFVASMKGGKPRLFIRNGCFPAWSPDGRYLAFTREVHCPSEDGVCTSRVFIVAAAGGKARAYGPKIADAGPLSWSR